MKPLPEPLPVPIPSDLAEVLKVHPSKISHVNMGRRRLTPEQAIKLMEISLTDTRLKGLHIIDLLHPKYQPTRPWICKPLPKRLRRVD
jgi:predicted transcriptional regulator